jgi:hypothetical protein
MILWKKGTAAILLVALSLLALAGCGGGASANTPSSVAEAFLKGLIAHDAGGSYAFMSLKSEGETGMTLASWNGMMIQDPIPKTTTFAVKTENIQGNTATVTITAPGGVDHVVNLSNENGNWKVDWQLGEWYGLAPGT